MQRLGLAHGPAGSRGAAGAGWKQHGPEQQAAAPWLLHGRGGPAIRAAPVCRLAHANAALHPRTNLLPPTTTWTTSSTTATTATSHPQPTEQQSGSPGHRTVPCRPRRAPDIA